MGFARNFHPVAVLTSLHSRSRTRSWLPISKAPMTPSCSWSVTWGQAVNNPRQNRECGQPSLLRADLRSAGIKETRGVEESLNSNLKNPIDLMKQIRILLAEDHTVVRQGLRALLQLEPDF